MTQKNLCFSLLGIKTGRYGLRCVMQSKLLKLELDAGWLFQPGFMPSAFLGLCSLCSLYILKKGVAVDTHTAAANAAFPYVLD